jgi:hypothetical protein
MLNYEWIVVHNTVSPRYKVRHLIHRQIRLRKFENWIERQIRTSAPAAIIGNKCQCILTLYKILYNGSLPEIVNWLFKLSAIFSHSTMITCRIKFFVTRTRDGCPGKVYLLKAWAGLID